MNVIGSLLEHYGLAAGGYLLALIGLVMLLTGKLRTKTSFDEMRDSERTAKLDAQKTSEAWRDSYLKVTLARDADQELIRGSVTAAETLADLMTKLNEALRVFVTNDTKSGGDESHVAVQQEKVLSD